MRSPWREDDISGSIPPRIKIRGILETVMKNLKFILIIVVLAIFAIGLANLILKESVSQSSQVLSDIWWEVQSIDTVKYSRDVAREKANDTSFDKIIDTHVRLISETGATHVALGTPYDPEFIPYLSRWVKAARKYGLKVWFRGNLSGWEGWFGYEKIDRGQHSKKIGEFILDNGNLFEDGDIFSSCPECENGGSGDPRLTRDIEGHRSFLGEEYKVTNEAFRKIGKNVRSNFAPMNLDVAKLIMDEQTTKALGSIVVIDHYVRDWKKLSSDIKDIAKKSQGKVVLGEFGAPIPDIHGNLSESEQSTWIFTALTEISSITELIGVNYWTGFGGSTKIWEDNYRPRPAVSVVQNFYKPKVLAGVVRNEIGLAIKGAQVSSASKSTLTSGGGEFSIPTLSGKETVTIEKEGYVSQQIGATTKDYSQIVLVKEKEGIPFLIQKLIYRVTQKLAN